LLRGAGPSGLAAMRPRRRLDEADPAAPWLIRPLLDTPRAAIEAYCVAQKLQPRYDGSNQSPIYARNRVRHHILPLLKTYNPAIIATLGRTARICAEDAALLHELADDLWHAAAVIDADGIVIDRARFEAAHPALKRRIVQRAAGMLTDAPIDAKHIDLALQAIAGGRRRVQLPGRVWLIIRRGALRFVSES
jgi:tRNA(Ile)-lysidine synthase